MKNVSFTIEPGKTYALVGPSGGGKTTIFSLIERFYLPQEGKITLGDRDIQDFDLTIWRAQFGYVSQEVPIISGTIKENICYGFKERIDDELIRKQPGRRMPLNLLKNYQMGLKQKSGKGELNFPAVNVSGLPLRGRF